MSNLSTQVFGDMNYLYEHIANRDAQQLNENSDHYDEEFAELVEDIISTISLSMVYEGYSANGIISFLASSPNEDIIEKYLSFDENILIESTVSEDYIVEQLDQLNEFVGAALRVLGAGLKAAKYAKGAKGLAPVSRLASGLKGAGTAAERVSKQGLKQSSVIRSGLTKGVEKVKDVAKSAKTALTSPTAKKVALGTAALGAATGAGYLGAKMAGAGSGNQGPSPSGGKPEKSGTPGSASNSDFTKGSTLAKLGGREGRIKDGEFRTMGWSQQSKDRYNKAKGSATPPPAPKLPAPTGSGGGSGAPSPAKPKASVKPAKPAATGPAIGTTKDGTKFERRTPTSKELAASKAAGGGEAGIKAAVTAGKPTTGPEASEAQKSEAGAYVTAYQAKQKADFERKQKEAATQKESYDLVLEYLFDYGHADTIEEAEYLMTELDESFIQSLVETYHANLLAEEVEAWVNELIEEGYDLSEYTWDDMVDYYFTEEKGDGNLANNYPPYDKVTRGDIISGALGQDKMGGKNKSKKSKNC